MNGFSYVPKIDEIVFKEPFLQKLTIFGTTLHRAQPHHQQHCNTRPRGQRARDSAQT